MKKLILILSVVMLCIMQTSAFDVTEDYYKNEITINGQTAQKALVSVQVLKPGKVFEDIQKNNDADSIVAYNNQVQSDSEGNLSDSFELDGESNIYNAYLSYTGLQSPIKAEIHFINKDEYAALAENLNADSEDEFAKHIKENPYIFSGIDTLDKTIDIDAAISNFYAYVKETPLDTCDVKGALKLYNTFLFIQGLSDKKITSSTEMLENIMVSDKLLPWIDMILKNSDAKEYFNIAMQDIKTDSITEFDKKITEKVILTVVKYPGGYINAKNIMQQYKDFLNIYSTSDIPYKAVAGNEYKSKETLKTAFESAQPSSGGAGGGGGNSSKSTSSNVASISVMPQNVKTESIQTVFNDVDCVAWATQAIIALSDKNIINGKSENRFFPNDNVTREEFVKMLILASGIALENGKNNFNDVQEQQWYTKYINAAQNYGIVTGHDNGNFGIGENITRQDMAVMIYNVVKPMETAESEFADTDTISDYAKAAVACLQKAEIINGDENLNFAPLKYATRAEAATIIYNMIKYLD